MTSVNGTSGDTNAILEVSGLTVTYGSGKSAARAVDNVDLILRRNATVALVGESGSGKTTLGRALMRLIRPDAGRIEGKVLFRGQDLLQVSESQLSDIRGRDIAMVFQEPMRSLNPAFTVGDQIAEGIRRHERCSRSEARRRVVSTLGRVHIPSPERYYDRYPFELSGGMCQRVMTAMAISCNPAVLIADEPTTALDVTVQAQVLDLLKELQEELGLAMLFITHDLGVVADVADEVMVMYAGQVVEYNDAPAVFAHPSHPYTAGLLASIPSVADRSGELHYIKGQVPNARVWPARCRFADRCGYATDLCNQEIPLVAHAGGLARCVRVDDLVAIDG